VKLHHLGLESWKWWEYPQDFGFSSQGQNPIDKSNPACTQDETAVTLYST